MNYVPSQPALAKEPISHDSPWRRVRPLSGDRHTPLLFWLTVLALGCASLGSVTWGASSLLAKKGSEKLLRVELLLPQLKCIKEWHVTAPPTQLPPGSVGNVKIEELPHHEGHLASSTVESWLHLKPKEHTAPPPLVEASDDSLVYLHPPGDSPMIRTWKMLTMYSVMTAVTFPLMPELTPIIYAQEKNSGVEELRNDIKMLIQRIDAMERKPEPDIGKIVKDGLKKLEDGTLADIEKSVQGVKKSVDGVKNDISTLQLDQKNLEARLKSQKSLIDELEDRLASLRKSLVAGNANPAGNTAAPAPAVDKAFMDEFRSSMKVLNDTQRALNETIAKLGPIAKRDSMSPPVNGSPAAATGRVMLVNLYSEDLLFIINGRQHRVPAKTQRLIEGVPTGRLQYEVFAERWGTLDNRATTLASGDTFTLTASNQP